MHGVLALDFSDRVSLAVAVLSLVILVPMFFSTRQLGSDGDAISVVGHLTTNTSVRRRHARSLRWEVVSGEHDINLRDFVYVPSGSSASVQLTNGQSATLPADTLVEFDEVTLNDLRIALREQKKVYPVRILPLPKSESLYPLPDIEPLAISLDKLTHRLHELLSIPTPKPPTVHLRTLASEPKVRTLRDFEVRLLRPKSGQLIEMDRSTWLVLSWTGVPIPGVSFELQLSRSPVFSPLITYQTPSTKLRIQLDDLGTYYWRISAQQKDNSMLSQSGSFNLTAKQRVGKSDRSTAVMVPSGYALEIASDPKFENVIGNSVSKVTECEAAGLSPGKYFCRVSPVDGSDAPRTYSFEVPGR